MTELQSPPEPYMESAEMVDDPYHTRDILRDYVQLNERVNRIELRYEAHQEICIRLNAKTLKEIAQIRWLALGLLVIEVGKATWSSLLGMFTGVH
jgi:hypothetical protein